MEKDFSKTEELLRKAGRAVHISDAEKSRVRANLLHVINTPAPRSWWSVIVHANLIRFGVVPLVIIFLVAGGVTVASAKTLPGDLLYLVKTEVLEPVQGFAYTKTEEKITYRQFLADKRLQEMVELVSVNKLNDEEENILFSNFDEYQKVVSKDAGEVSLEELVEAESHFESSLRAYGRIFAQADREDIEEKIQTRVTRALQSRSKAEQELGISKDDLEGAANRKELEAREIVASVRDEFEVAEDTRTKLQAETQVDLADQAIEEGEKNIEVGAFAQAIVSFEKAKRFAREAYTVFSAQQKYALAPRELSVTATEILEEKTRAPIQEDIIQGDTGTEAVATMMMVEDESEKTDVNIYVYFEERISELVDGESTPTAYMKIFPDLMAKDFRGVTAKGGVYEVSDGEVVFAEAGTPNNLSRRIESVGHAQLLINIATRLGTELITIENVDSIILQIQESPDSSQKQEKEEGAEDVVEDGLPDIEQDAELDVQVEL